MRILFRFDAPRLRAKVESSHPDLQITWCAEDDDPTFAAELPRADVLWHVLRPIEASDLHEALNLKLIQKLGSGLNTIDLAAAEELGVGVSNMVGANSQSVCEAALALMLATARRVEIDRSTRSGRGWPPDPTLGESIFELGSSTVGLIGYGAVARRLETVLRALGSEVIHTSSSYDGSESWVDLQQLLTRSRVVSLHLPLTEATHHLIGPDQLAAMPPGSILVNTARGPIVDESALVDALRGGHLSGAGLDVFEAEPTQADNELFTLSNVVVAPHTAWLSTESLLRSVSIAADNVRRLERSETLTGQILAPTRA